MRIALAGLASLAVAMGIGRFAFTPLLPMMQGDSGLSLIAGGWLAGAVYAGVGVGIVVAGALCAALMAWRAASSEAWIVLGAVSLLSTLLIWNVFSPSGSTGRGRETRQWSAQWWPLVLCYGAFGFGYIIPATFLPAMARGEVADPARFGWAWPAFGAAAAA